MVFASSLQGLLGNRFLGTEQTIRRHKGAQTPSWICHTAQWYLPSLEFTSAEESRPRKARRQDPAIDPGRPNPGHRSVETESEEETDSGPRRSSKNGGQEGKEHLSRFKDTPLPSDAANSKGRKAASRSRSRSKRQRREPANGEGAARPASNKAVRGDEGVGEYEEGSEEAQAAIDRLRTARGDETLASEPYQATELIFKIERHGEGWGEEIFPHITVEKRALGPVRSPNRRNRAERPDPWEDGSPEWYLCDTCGVPEDRVDAVMTTATAWRVTPGGRPLIDRRRRSRVARNVVIVTEYLESLGVPAGREGVGTIFMRAPQLMLCKPTTTDRWDRRAVELAHHAYIHGNCNVSEEQHELSMWTRRQRNLWQQGSLNQDRMQILMALGFEAATENAITEEWEFRFDQFVEWLLGSGRGREACSGLDWGRWGGIQGRECCIWAQLQRHLRASNLMPAEAIRRLETLNFVWEIQRGSAEERVWSKRLGSLMFCIERTKKLATLRDHPSQTMGMAAIRKATEAPRSSEAQEEHAARAQVEVALQLAEEGHMESGEVEWLQQGLGIESSSGLQEVCRRRVALADARLSLGLSFWLARQRRDWRLGRLSLEQAKLLRLAGVEMDPYDVDQWREEAHRAASFLLGSRIKLVNLLYQCLSSAQDTMAQTVDAPSASSSGNSGSVASISGGGMTPEQWQSGTRLRVERWLETQQALYAERRLSRAQLHYLAMLELTWLVGKEGRTVRQAARELQLGRSITPTSLSSQFCQTAFGSQLGRGILPREIGTQVRDREQQLQLQRALHLLHWGSAIGAHTGWGALGASGWSCTHHRGRTEDDQEWDDRLTQLLAFRRESGSERLSAEDLVATPELSHWLSKQLDLWSDQRLSDRRITQLASLGVQQPRFQAVTFRPRALV